MMVSQQEPGLDEVAEQAERLSNRQLRNHVYSGPSKLHGTGLFAVRDIVCGEYIGTYHGPRAKRDGTYVLWVTDPDNEEDSEGRSGRNLLRYLNHAEPGNAEFFSFDLYARQDINMDDEITFNYNGSE